jgi:hypothetical protein
LSGVVFLCTHCTQLDGGDCPIKHLSSISRNQIQFTGIQKYDFTEVQRGIDRKSCRSWQD